MSVFGTFVVFERPPADSMSNSGWSVIIADFVMHISNPVSMVTEHIKVLYRWCKGAHPYSTLKAKGEFNSEPNGINLTSMARKARERELEVHRSHVQKIRTSGMTFLSLLPSVHLPTWPLGGTFNGEFGLDSATAAFLGTVISLVDRHTCKLVSSD